MEVSKMEVIYDLLLDVGHSGCKQCIELKKSEANAKKLRIELCKGTEPIIIDRESTIAMIRAYKPDGKIIFNSATVTDESKIEYTLGTQDTAVSGTIWYEVQLIADEDGERKVLYSAQFKAVIDDTVVDDGKITSSDEFGKLVDTIADNKQWITKKNTELNIWMNEQSSLISERESEHNSIINEKESEHIDLINNRTLKEKESFKLTDEDNTTPDKEYKPAYGGSYLTFTSKELQCDLFDVLKIIGGTSTNMIDVYRINDDNTKTQIGVINSGSNFDYRLYDMSGVRKYVIVIREIGAKDADISKFEFVKLSRAVYRNEVFQEITRRGTEPVSATAVIEYIKTEAANMMPKATTSTPGIIKLAGGYETALGEDNESAITPYNIKYILTKQGAFADDEMSDDSNGIVKNKVIKAYVDNLVNAVRKLNIINVTELPAKEDIDESAIYLVPKSATASDDVCNEYVWNPQRKSWELIGNTAIDLSDYYTHEETDRQIEDYCGQLEHLDSDIYDTNLVFVMNRINKFVKQKAKIFVLEGNAEPTQTTSDYPDIKIGDICINKSYRMWICTYTHESATFWNELLTATSPYLSGNFYSKTNIDTMLGKYAKTTEYAKNNGTAGVVKVTNGIYGIKNIESGIIGTVKATDADIAQQENDFKPIVPSNLKKAVETIGGVITNLKTEDKSSYVNALNEVLGYATRERSWKKIRTIVVPSDEYLGQTIDGVAFKRGSADTTNTGTQICRVEFTTDEDGNVLGSHGITSVHIKMTPSEAIHINQGFLAYNNNLLIYMSNIKANTAVRHYELPISGSYIAGQTGLVYNYLNNIVNVKNIEKITFGGHERESVLGEGTKLEVWAYGYWDEAKEVISDAK